MHETHVIKNQKYAHVLVGLGVLYLFAKKNRINIS